MREQIRLWFYSQFFMAVTLVGGSPYRRVLTYEKLLDQTGREMHRSWGNSIDANDAFERMGADVMRWQFCETSPSQNLKFGYGPAGNVKRRLLTLWNSCSFLVTYANIEGFEPAYEDLIAGPPTAQPLDRWVIARTRQLVADATAGYDRYRSPEVTRVFEEFVDDLSNWYIRRSRRRFYSYDEAAFRTLWFALAQALRCDRAGHAVPGRRALAKPGRRLVRRSARLGPSRPLARVGGARHRAAGRGGRGQGGRRARAAGPRRGEREAAAAAAARVGVRIEAAGRHLDEIKEELRVKEVVLLDSAPVRFGYKPNLPVLGPKLGPRLRDVKAALEAGEFEELGDGRIRAAGQELGPDELLVEREKERGWPIRSVSRSGSTSTWTTSSSRRAASTT
jgi:isoleucyl-tRNA synthetase